VQLPLTGVEVIYDMLQSDFSKPVTADLVEKAIQTIILRRPDRSWDEKIYMQKEKVNGKMVTVVGL